MKTNIPEGARVPQFWEAMISLFSLVVGISISIVFYGLDPHIQCCSGFL